ncbi:hypothetical protein ACHAW6_007267 [Cyclotella cf. meneghiniana]
MEAINNMYELPSMEKAIKYLHVVAGSPSWVTLIKAIRAGNYNSWPVITVQNIKKYFPNGVDESFSMHLWDCLLSQAEMLINLLR